MRFSKDKKIETLGKVPLFSACSRKELARISALADEVTVDPGFVLTHEGKTGRECFIVAEGKANIIQGGRKVAEALPGSIVGEMALLDKEPRTATVEATEAMTLFVLDQVSFGTMLTDAPIVARKMMKNLAQRIRIADSRPV